MASKHQMTVAMDVKVSGKEVLQEWLRNFGTPGNEAFVEQAIASMNAHRTHVFTADNPHTSAAPMLFGANGQPLHENGFQSYTHNEMKWTNPDTGKPWTEAEMANVMGTAGAPNSNAWKDQTTGGNVGIDWGKDANLDPQLTQISRVYIDGVLQPPGTPPPLQIHPDALADLNWQPVTVGINLTPFQTIEEYIEEQFGPWDDADFPHEDTRVLHGPGRCSECDKCSFLQAARMKWGIAFTDDPVRGGDMPCPSSKGWRWLAKVFARRIVAKAVRMLVVEREGRAITFGPDA